VRRFIPPSRNIIIESMYNSGTDQSQSALQGVPRVQSLHASDGSPFGQGSSFPPKAIQDS